MEMLDELDPSNSRRARVVCEVHLDVNGGVLIDDSAGNGSSVTGRIGGALVAAVLVVLLAGCGPPYLADTYTTSTPKPTSFDASKLGNRGNSWGSEALWCVDNPAGASVRRFEDQRIRTEVGMPKLVIRLSALHPIFASVRCVGRVLD